MKRGWEYVAAKVGKCVHHIILASSGRGERGSFDSGNFRTLPSMPVRVDTVRGTSLVAVEESRVAIVLRIAGTYRRRRRLGCLTPLKIRGHRDLYATVESRGRGSSSGQSRCAEKLPRRAAAAGSRTRPHPRGPELRIAWIHASKPAHPCSEASVG